MYIDKPEKEFKGANLFFGIQLIKGAAERIAKILFPFPISTGIQEMIDKTNSKQTIRYMSPEEEMRYLISTHNENNR